MGAAAMLKHSLWPASYRVGSGTSRVNLFMCVSSGALTFSCAFPRAREGGPPGQRFRSGGAGAELSGRQRYDPIETAGRGAR
jgi:hypothetical protein